MNKALIVSRGRGREHGSKQTDCGWLEPIVGNQIKTCILAGTLVSKQNGTQLIKTKMGMELVVAARLWVIGLGKKVTDKVLQLAEECVHLAMNSTVRPRRRDAAYLQT
ncbi:hypothetical protein Tco_0587682 [Tanacetum coccineum]